MGLRSAVETEPPSLLRAVARWPSSRRRRATPAHRGPGREMTEILTLTAAPGPVGNIGVAAVARTTVRPYINVDQSFVIVKADPEEDQYNVVFFEEGEDESPVAISEYLYALFEGDTGPTSEAAQLAAIAMENGKFETVMNKRQLQKIAGGMLAFSQWSGHASTICSAMRARAAWRKVGGAVSETGGGLGAP